MTEKSAGPLESYPSYRRLLAGGELDDRAARAWEAMRRCTLCPRRCSVDRMASIDGVACRIGPTALVDGFGPHHGEESPLRGSRGSGAIFFSGCSLRCEYCQNWEISQDLRGEPVSAEGLAEMMVELQRAGCHNVNLVSPTHVVPHVLAALAIAARDGLRLPLVYNTGGYDATETLALLDGVVDIYMPDAKYGDSETAHRLSHVRDYVPVNRAAIREMHRQVGDLVLDEDGVASRGLLVRHLVLPGDLAGTSQVVRFLAEEISRDTYVNLMDQYRPCHRAWEHPSLDRGITRAEYVAALEMARAQGLGRLDPGRSRFPAV